MIEKITIYTDGSCYWKTGEGGIGIYIVNTNKAFHKGYSNTSTSRMEIRALLVAIKQVKNIPSEVTVKCDNQYVVNSIKERWVYDWEISNWSGRVNADLWKKVLREIRKRDKVKFILKWVKGHQKDLTSDDAFYNALVDKLCDYKQFKERTKDYVDEN